jgi:hypothetical protein
VEKQVSKTGGGNNKNNRRTLARQPKIREVEAGKPATTATEKTKSLGCTLIAGTEGKQEMSSSSSRDGG